MNRRRYQYGSLAKKSNRLSEDVWQFRFYETTPGGRSWVDSARLLSLEDALEPFDGWLQGPSDPCPSRRKLENRQNTAAAWEEPWMELPTNAW